MPIKRSWIFIIISFIIIACKVSKRTEAELHSLKINGPIKTWKHIINSYNQKKDYVNIQVNDSEYNINLTPILNEFQFYEIARVGDTILKKAQNDTLYLIRGNVRFPYLANDTL
jgi:hypothetical protein